MNMEKRDALVKKIGNVNQKNCIVSLEDFFVGNDDGGSIWCNLLSEPEPNYVFKTLLDIRDKPDVADVKIMITQFDGGVDEWPFSDTIIFITSATIEQIQNHLGEDNCPDEIGLDTELTQSPSLNIPQNMKAIVGWWD